LTPRRFRTDTTVVEANIHYPTDSSLLWDSWRVSARLLRRARQDVRVSPGEPVPRQEGQSPASVHHPLCEELLAEAAACGPQEAPGASQAGPPDRGPRGELRCGRGGHARPGPGGDLRRSFAASCPDPHGHRDLGGGRACGARRCRRASESSASSSRTWNSSYGVSVRSRSSSAHKLVLSQVRQKFISNFQALEVPGAGQLPHRAGD